MSIIVVPVSSLTPNRDLVLPDRGCDARVISDLSAALTMARGGPVLVLVERAAVAIAEMLVQNMAPRSALRRWTSSSAELLGLIRGRRSEIVLACRRTAECDSERLAQALRGPLGTDISPATLVVAARAGRRSPLDPVTEVVAEVVLSTDAKALAADAELEALLTVPLPAETQASRHARLALAAAALRNHIELIQAHERLTSWRAASCEAQRLAAERFNLLVRSRDELALGTSHNQDSALEDMATNRKQHADLGSGEARKLALVNPEPAAPAARPKVTGAKSKLVPPAEPAAAPERAVAELPVLPRAAEIVGHEVIGDSYEHIQINARAMLAGTLTVLDVKIFVYNGVVGLELRPWSVRPGFDGWPVDAEKDTFGGVLRLFVSKEDEAERWTELDQFVAADRERLVALSAALPGLVRDAAAHSPEYAMSKLGLEWTSAAERVAGKLGAA